MKSRKEMTDAEIDRLDNLEWKVRCFLSNINPSCRAKDAVKPEDWDMDAVSAVIETAWENAYKDMEICTENEFYPYRDEDDDRDCNSLEH